jgi:RNA polymerase sigma-70 factor (ECF subfamily)
MLADTQKFDHVYYEFYETIRCDIMTELREDIELMRRIVARDESALRELYTCYGQRLYAYALRLTGDPHQAEDVVQDTLVVVWASAGKFRFEGRLLAWLLGIVHHTAMKSLRHGSIPISDAMEDSLPAQEPLPDEQIQSGELARHLQNALQQLTPVHRAMLELIFYQGLSLKETARVCGCPTGTVKSRLSYARQQLRGILARLEEDL